jgi:hypothetical protein
VKASVKTAVEKRAEKSKKMMDPWSYHLFIVVQWHCFIILVRAMPGDNGFPFVPHQNQRAGFRPENGTTTPGVPECDQVA